MLRLRRSGSPKGERQIGEILKNNRIGFEARVQIGRYEVDFIIGRVAIEVDGTVHRETNTAKDIYLAKRGYVPIHIITKGKKTEAIAEELINIIKANNQTYGRNR